MKHMTTLIHCLVFAHQYPSDLVLILGRTAATLQESAVSLCQESICIEDFKPSGKKTACLIQRVRERLENEHEKQKYYCFGCKKP